MCLVHVERERERERQYLLVFSLANSSLSRNSAKCREGALLGFECLCEKLGKLFEPYVFVSF